MGSVVPYGTVGVQHTRSELRDLSCFGAVCSYPLGKQPARIAGAGARADLWTQLALWKRRASADGQKAMTTVGHTRPELNADNAT